MATDRTTPLQRALLVASGISDWLIIIGTGVGGYYLGNITPNKRPFQLENPDISFPYTVHETVSSKNLVIATVAIPAAVIFIVSLVAVPGFAAPPGTPQRIIWKRKFWEFYASILAFALGMASQWFIINGLKNVCGKPRPDLLARCQPDLQNVAQYVVGGIANITSNGQLVDASICKNTDSSTLDDGFRSYPSGHSSSSAAGLGHLALFLAFKFGVVFPFSTPTTRAETGTPATFSSRIGGQISQDDAYELVDRRVFSHPTGQGRQNDESPTKLVKEPTIPLDIHPALPARQNGAAPPLYLILIVLVPFGGSVFIAASRWFNYRHHGFDILFGYLIGTITTLVSFRMYHLPLTHGAGWAWGPRSPGKAFWAGVGSNSWATPQRRWSIRAGDEEEGYRAAAQQTDYRPDTPITQVPSTPQTMGRGESTSYRRG